MSWPVDVGQSNPTVDSDTSWYTYGADVSGGFEHVHKG